MERLLNIRNVLFACLALQIGSWRPERGRRSQRDERYKVKNQHQNNRIKNNPLRVVSTAEAPKPLITGCILALNEEKRIEGAILSFSGLADRVIVIDNGSAD